MQDRPRRSIPKMQGWKKILYCLCVTLLCFALTGGDPKRKTIFNQIEITDEKLEYLLEMTFATRTTKFIHRINQKNKGLWKYIEQYIRSPRWADIQVNLQTRIGIRVKSISYDKLNNNIHIDFGDPEVLASSYQTRILSSSDNFFSSWSISEFEEHKDQFLKDFLENKKFEEIENFKSNSIGVSELQSQCSRKIMMALNSNYNNLAPEVLLFKFNQYVLRLMASIIPHKMLESSMNSSYFYTKQMANTTAISKTRKQTQGKQEGNKSSKTQHVKQESSMKQINDDRYKEQIKQRQKMKRKLQL